MKTPQYEFPENWELGNLENLITFNQIGIIRSRKEQGADKQFRYLKMDNIYNSNGFKDSGYVFVNANEDEIKKYSLKQNDFLFNTRNSFELVGKTCLFDSKFQEPILFNNNIMRMRFREVLIPKFVEYAFSSEFISEQLENMKSGTTSVVGIYYKSLKNLQIPIPPLTEQNQIVTLLDSAFAKIDQAKANIEKNIANAKELFQSKLNAIFSQRGEGWEEKKLKEITTKIGSGSTPRGGQSSYKESGISLIRSMNVHDDGFRDKKLAFIDNEQAKKLDNVTIQENDVLLNITGASVARCCIVDKSYLPARVNQHVSIIRLKDDIMNHRLLHYILTSKENKDLLLGIGEQGATRQAITKVQIENFKINYPIDVEVQNTIVKSVDKLKIETERLSEIYQTKMTDLEELKKSLLQKAFAGELTQLSELGLVGLEDDKIRRY